MKICIIGTGYVGLSAGVSLAHIGHEVVCIDSNAEKINNLKRGIIPIFEPKMADLINANKDKISFSTNLSEVTEDFDVYYIAVGTPTIDNKVDTSQVIKTAQEIVENIKKYTVIINKSTVPIGFNKELKKSLQNKTNIEFDIVSNPEFLKQGSAIDDFLNPERIVIGSSSKKAIELVEKIYAPIIKEKNQLIITDENSAELSKYACNSFLALKISYMNEIAKLCEKTGADIENIKKVMASDSRIGAKFLNAGLGFGGSCFPKDTKAIVSIAKENNAELKTIESTIQINSAQIDYFIQKILAFYNNDIKNKTFALWGIAFKPNTNDTREAPSLKLIEKLKLLGANIIAYDSKAKTELIEQKANIEDTIQNANALIIATEWDEFKNFDLKKLTKLKDRVIFDGRNIYINKNLKEYDLKYICIGKNEQ